MTNKAFIQLGTITSLVMALTGCEYSEDEEGQTGGGTSGEYGDGDGDYGDGDGDGDTTGSTTDDGGPSCDAPLQAAACAGSVYEQAGVTGRTVTFYSESVRWACNETGYYYYYPYYPYGSGGGSGYGDTGGYYGETTTGETTTGDYYGDTSGDTAGYYDGDTDGSSEEYYGDTGGYEMGGAPGTGGGSWEGSGGAIGGSPATGGNPGYPSIPEGSWCSDLPLSTTIAGISYSVDECGHSELKLPVTYQEPEGWYRLRVYGGSSSCDRGELLAETSGYGLGEVRTFDVDAGDSSFISLELSHEEPFWGTTMTLELNPIQPVSPGGE